MRELKPGYWKTRDGRKAFVYGKNPLGGDDANVWIGAVVGEGPVGWFDDGCYFDDDESRVDLIEYIGPTLPPEPGEGYRLLGKGEDYFGSDEFYDTGTWRRVAGSDDYTGLCHKQFGTGFWYRRRVTPEPPTPPEGWELLKDGTEWQPEFMRLYLYRDGTFSTWGSARRSLCEGFASGSGPFGLQDNLQHLWYARRIESEPDWTPTDEYRAIITVGQLCGHETACMVPVSYPQRKYVCGDKSEWRDVPVGEA